MRIDALALLAITTVATCLVLRPAHAQAVNATGASPVLDVTRSGAGSLRDTEGADHPFDQARLRLGGNGEFELVIAGDSTYQLVGTWSGDLRFGPVSLDLRMAGGRRAGGVGRAWVRDRSWDHDRSFDRVELDGWSGTREFGLYFDAETRVVER